MIQELTLTAAVNNIPVAVVPQVGVFLVVVLRHDNTGVQRQIVWDPLFRLVDTAIDEFTANSNNSYTFHGRTDPNDGIVKWFLVGRPVIGEL